MIVASGASLLCATPAMAHASERGQIMLLPTHLFIVGGAMVVVASITVAAAVPALTQLRISSVTIPLPRLHPRLPIAASLASLAFIALLIAAGYRGPADPISNPLPGVVWTLWWVGFTWFSMFIGNIWHMLNPWTGLYAIVAKAGWRPLFKLPPWVDHWPAVLLFFGFAWFELIYPIPSDPHRLATAVLIYLLLTFTGLLLFGSAWLKSGECFSLYFRFVSLLSPMQWSVRDQKLSLQIGIPGFALLREKEVDRSFIALVLLALAAVSFDGFSRTFFWVAGQGLNPLEFPGRSAVALSNSFAFAVMFFWMATIFRGAATAGGLLAGTKRVPELALAIVPIAVAFHAAHYLPEFPAALMRLAKALTDPVGTGLDLLGTASLNPPASIMMDHRTAAFVFYLQTAIIVLGHMTAVAIAHLMALRVASSPRIAVLSQLPLNAVMVLYTAFGLWLLSTPVVS